MSRLINFMRREDSLDSSHISVNDLEKVGFGWITISLTHFSWDQKITESRFVDHQFDDLHQRSNDFHCKTISTQALITVD